MKFPQPDPKKSISAAEEVILKFWKDNQIFERTVESRSREHEFRFFDGPPFATGTPHYGHILAGTIKDAIPRYKTMQGYRVERKWGWDCHGVPVEFQVEKEHKIGGKPGIEKMGVGKFNELCRSVVMRCADEWEQTVDRMGRFVDFKNDYKTMDPEFMESVWWVFGELWKKGLVYEGEKVIAYSPKLGSPLSNFEANLNYRDIDDPAVTVKFELTNEAKKEFNKRIDADLKRDFKIDSTVGLFDEDSKVSLLAWTTTPWTLPSNLALAVNKDFLYTIFKEPETGEFLIVASDLYPKFAKDFVKTEEDLDILFRASCMGDVLEGLSYKPLFPWFADHDGAFRVLSADYVSAEDGTGIVHQAPNFGEDDARVCFENKIKPLEQPIDDSGFFTDRTPELAGKYFRDDPEVEGSKENNANKWVIAALEELGALFRREQVRHSYPFCWRTDCALMYRGVRTWFVDVQQVKALMIEKNQEINWIPDHLRDGRFGKLLEGAPDWAISRNRYWGTPIPVWRCEKCGEVHVPTTCAELEKLTGEKVDDLHKHFVDDLHWNCPKCTEETEITFIRHGQTDNNTERRFQGSQNIPLNEMGRAEAEKLRNELEKFDVVISAPLDRATDTAKILFPGAEIVIDDRIREKNHGELEGMTEAEILEKFSEWKTKDDIRYSDAPGGDSFERDLRPRVRGFLADVQRQFPGKKIAVVTHRATICALYEESGVGSLWGETIPNLYQFSTKLRPQMRRIEEVLDCWFESGAMPYASNKFHGETPDFPSADFIAEGLDQTRGWFYTLHVLGCALFGKSIFKNVITNGIVLAEDGQKMSKSKKNYPDPHLVFDQYGADAMRYYLVSSPVVRGENFKFMESGVAEVLKSVILPLRSAYQFFSTYANIDDWQPTRFEFVRHGQGDHNVARIYSGNVENQHHLTEIGQEQVRATAQKLNTPDVLIASPFVRTQETAKIVAEQTGYSGEIVTDDRVRELFFGPLEGKEFINRDARMAHPETEKNEDVEERVREFLSDWAPRVRGKHVVVCSHGGVLASLEGLKKRITTDDERLRVPVPQTGTTTVAFPEPETTNELDQWVLSELQKLLRVSGEKLEMYDLEGALRGAPRFIDQLNNWYLRRSRQRFWASGMNDDKRAGYETLHHVLLMLAKMLAPVCPFFAEELYQNLGGGESVHLELFPNADPSREDDALNKKMDAAREITRLSGAIRSRAKIKLRQPLQLLQVAVPEGVELDLNVIAAEANVKKVDILTDEQLAGVAKKIVKVNARVIGKKYGKKVQELIVAGKKGDFTDLGDGRMEIAGETLELGEYEAGYLTAEGVEAEASADTVVLLDTEISPELEIEGVARDLIRATQETRKNSGLEVSERIVLNWKSDDSRVIAAFEKWGEMIAEETLASEIETAEVDADPIDLDGASVRLNVQRG